MLPLTFNQSLHFGSFIQTDAGVIASSRLCTHRTKQTNFASYPLSTAIDAILDVQSVMRNSVTIAVYVSARKCVEEAIIAISLSFFFSPPISAIDAVAIM